MLELSFEAKVVHWRGPAPFFFAPVPDRQAPEVQEAARLASYGWGVVPVTAVIGDVRFTTSLFPRSGTYLLPLKDAVRRATGVTEGDIVAVTMTITPHDRPG